ncbi:MAG: enoyl-CoA hydratase/isomerase family protein [Parvularculaceae bacterium]|nr:enoyl-CoA hydratase/isomerase family protein [Parvularculaceae bacterium]
MSEILNYSVENDVAVATIDSPPVNALSHAVRSAVVEGVTRAGADPKAKAVVIRCGGRTFFAGADISEFGKEIRTPTLHDVLEAIEACAKPVVAAIHGTALGGGLELALCCHYRVAVPSAKVGLPEVALGLLPGAGGTQRLPRIVGAAAALDMITSGKPIGAQQALETGVVDALVGETSLRADAIAFAQKLIDTKAPLKRVRDRDEKIKADRGNTKLFDEFRKAHAREFRGFKAPESIIKCIEAAVNLPFNEGMKRERDLFLELLASKESAAQRYVFFAERQTAKIPDIPADAPVRDVKRVGVIGAGTMGGGIAMNFLNIGVPVTLIEQNEEALQRGVSVIRGNYETSAKKGKIKPDDVEKRMQLIAPSTDMSALAQTDLVIEAVYETMSIKKEVFGKLDGIARKGAILASNTSYLSIDEIAAATTRPEDVIGMHFFSPANVMPLLEVVRGRKSAKDAVSTAMTLAKKIGKTAVLSRVGPGFIANRVMSVRGREANAMVLEGVSPADIDRVIYDYGFAMGPFQMMDLVGLDVIGRDSNVKTVASELVRAGRLGQKKGGGYYDYDENRKPTGLSPVALKIIRDVAAERGVPQRRADDAEILARLLYPVVNEGAKVLAEGVALRGSDIDIACIKGYNWPVYRGGPMHWADAVGLGDIVSKLKEFEKRLGEAFAPAPLLEKLAKEGGRLGAAQGASA